MENFKRDPKFLFIVIQNNLLRTTYVKAKIDNSQNMCRLCCDYDETFNQIISECIKLSQKDYKSRHDWMGKVFY